MQDVEGLAAGSMQSPSLWNAWWKLIVSSGRICPPERLRRYWPHWLRSNYDQAVRPPVGGGW